MNGRGRAATHAAAATVKGQGATRGATATAARGAAGGDDSGGRGSSGVSSSSSVTPSSNSSSAPHSKFEHGDSSVRGSSAGRNGDKPLALDAAGHTGLRKDTPQLARPDVAAAQVVAGRRVDAKGGAGADVGATTGARPGLGAGAGAGTGTTVLAGEERQAAVWLRSLAWRLLLLGCRATGAAMIKW